LKPLRKKRIRSTLAAFGCLLFLLGIGPDLILCFGHDGHVALEIPSPEKDCGPVPRPGSPNGTSFDGNPSPPDERPSCCGSCLDIPLTVSTPAALARADSAHPAPEGPPVGRRCGTEHGMSGGDALSCAHPASFPGSSNRVTGSLRSTILRI